MKRGLLLLLPALAIAVIAGLLTINAHHCDAAFVFNQQNPRKVQPRQFEVVISKSREPVPSGKGLPAVGANCVPGNKGPKLNPWHCTVRYASGHRITYALEVQPNGRFEGIDPDGTRSVTGCCITGGDTPSG